MLTVPKSTPRDELDELGKNELARILALRELLILAGWRRWVFDDRQLAAVVVVSALLGAGLATLAGML